MLVMDVVVAGPRSRTPACCEFECLVIWRATMTLIQKHENRKNGEEEVIALTETDRSEAMPSGSRAALPQDSLVWEPLTPIAIVAWKCCVMFQRAGNLEMINLSE